MSEYLRIGELARRAGLSARTLRYYEEIGLVAPARRSPSGYRLYRRDAVERLAFIRRAKAMGLSLEEVRQVLAVHDAQGDPCVHVLELLDQKERQVAEAIRELTEFREALRDLRRRWRGRGTRSTDEGHICPIIQGELPAGGKTLPLAPAPFPSGKGRGRIEKSLEDAR